MKVLDQHYPIVKNPRLFSRFIYPNSFLGKICFNPDIIEVNLQRPTLISIPSAAEAVAQRPLAPGSRPWYLYIPSIF